LKTVIYNSPYLGGPGAAHWIVSSWREGFKHRGYAFHICEDPGQLAAKCEALRPDILFCDIVSTPIENATLRDLLTRLREQGTKVVLSIYWPMKDQPPARNEALTRFNIADLYCGEREADAMADFEDETGNQYKTMPLAANPQFHHPVPADPKFGYDITFVGAKLPKKRWFNETVLLPLCKRYQVGLFGPGWTLRDNTLRAISKASRMVKLTSLARLSDSQRFSISEEDEACLYASSKICINFHEREPDNSQPHHIVNLRVYKIAACGGFQIVDPVAALPQYFSSDEIVTAGFDQREWFDKIEYYLTHETERREIQERAIARAKGNHMAQHRVDYLEQLLGLSPKSDRTSNYT